MNKTKEIIKNFSPAWFAASMGTGGLANIFYQLGNTSNLLLSIGKILWLINSILFIVLLVPWVLRWFISLEHVKKHFAHPIISNFFVTMPAAAIILGTNFLAFGSDYFSQSFNMTFALVMWIIGSVLTLVFSLYIFYNMITAEEVSHNVTNFAWFIAPVGNIVIPVLGNGLVKYYAATNMRLAVNLEVLDISFFGIGFLLFIVILAILLNRFITKSLPPAAMLPTFWILLGPIGIATITLLGFANTIQLTLMINETDILSLFAILIWGFGIWAFGFIIMISIRYIKNGGVPFTLSWWAFIFPLSAYTLATIAIYHYTDLVFVHVFSIILVIMISCIWLATVIKTIIGVISLELLLPKKM